MTWYDPTFTTGQGLPALDLTHGHASSSHAREESNYYHLLNVQSVTETRVGSEAVEFRLFIDASPIGVLQEGDGAFKDRDIDISAVSEGIHSFTFEIGAGTQSQSFTFRFYKSPDMEYLTYWGNLVSTQYVIQLTNLTVIGHRVEKFW